MAYDNDVNRSNCGSCGSPLNTSSRFCPNCGAAATPPQTNERDAAYPSQPGYGQRPNVPNYLVQAILVTIFCCIPTGIVAIIFSAQVNSKLASGDYAGAVRDSNNAKTWCWVSLGLGIAATVVSVIFYALFFAALITSLGEF